MRKMIKTVMDVIKADSYGFTTKVEYGKSGVMNTGKTEFVMSLLLLFIIVILALDSNVNSQSAPTMVKSVNSIGVVETVVSVAPVPIPKSSRSVSYSLMSSTDDNEDNIEQAVPLSAGPIDQLQTHDAKNDKLIEMELPDSFYGDSIDYSTFQPYMAYQRVTLKGSGSYDICHSSKAYTDEYGLRRHKVSEDQFSINGQDDYMIALGTFYKPRGVIGNRYLIVTSTGSYTAITGDEKADSHTDPHNMFGMCGEYGALIEWIVDENSLDEDIALNGTVTNGGPKAVEGEILHIYRIDE